MNDKNRIDEHEDIISRPLPSDEQVLREVAGSPNGSQASRSSSSRREHRIVELLPEVENSDNSHRDDNWMIGAEFYDEDVVAENLDHQMSDDDRSVQSEVERQVVEVDSSSGDDDDFEDLIDMGYVVAPNEEDQSSSDDSNEDDDGADNVAANYDTTLPASHRYLGDNLEESRGRRILVDDSITNLPLFNLRHIVLLPGQVLPITTANLNPRIHMLLKACITNESSLIGLMSEPRENLIGTTAEIRNYSNREDEVRIIMEGRQRFKLISPPFETAIEGTIRILPEISLGRPFPNIPSWRRFLINAETPRQFIVSKHPHWLLRRYEASYITRRIIDQTKSWYNGDPTRDPNDFSYWIASNLPMSNHERMKVLAFNCTEARLLWLLDMLERSEFFGCSVCKNVICHKKDVFPMSCSGPQNSFVNSNGYVHDTMTVRNARGLIQEYEWSTEFSWFPGYAWRITCCEHCGRHIGWCYRSIKPDTKPKKFFGLSRANVRLQSSGQMPEQVIPPYVVEM